MILVPRTNPFRDSLHSSQSATRHKREFPQSHLMSCEIEAFKQAYIQNNFDPTIYPDIAKLTTTETNKPLDIFGIETSLPDGNFFVAGTVCKNFSMMRGGYRTDIEDKGVSGETFLAAVEVLEKKQPKWTLFENVMGAPWDKMSEYITGRVPAYLDPKSIKKLRAKNPARNSDRVSSRDIKFEISDDGESYVAEDVGGFYGVRPGAIIDGIFRCKTKKLEKIKPSKKKILLSQVIKEYNLVVKSEAETDILIFKKPCTYCTVAVKVDTKDFGLPQTRNRTYMFVYKVEDGKFDDDMGEYFTRLVEHLKSPVKHSLEAFILDEDHEVVRVFREALNAGPGRHTALMTSLEGNFWENTNNKDLAHNKSYRLKSDMKEMSRFTTNWGSNGSFRAPPHSWHEYLSICSGRVKDMIDCLTMATMRDAEAHDSNFSSFFWNISQNVTREPHRQGVSGVAGCITPGGDVFLPHLGRPLLGPEKLLLQGIPFFRLRLGNETEVNMSDLAGNAMSLSVVSACMLAAVTAGHFRKECQEEYRKKSKKVATAEEIIKAVGDKVLKNSLIETGDIMQVDEELEAPKGLDCMKTFVALAKISNEAFSASVLCTCESSGRISYPENGKFIACQDCGVSVCNTCVNKVQINSDTHNTAKMMFCTAAGRRSDPIAFESELRSKLPSQLHIPVKSVSEIASIEKDVYGVTGLENFVFQLTRVKRERHKWTVWYSAKVNHGTGKNVAQMILNIGSLEEPSKTFGMTAFLYCYQPTLEKMIPGRIKECIRLILPKDSTSAKWEIRDKPNVGVYKLVGSSPEESTRIKVGILPEAEKTLKQTSSAARKSRARDENGDGELGKRRWGYAKGWQEWPKVIKVGEGNNPDIDGEYEKLKCKHTAPHSALWRRKGSEASRFILLWPNVSRVAPDHGVISSSPNVKDASSVVLKLAPLWQPCDALNEKFHLVKGCKLIRWKTVSKSFTVVIPDRKVSVKEVKRIERPKPASEVTLGSIEGLDQYTLSELTRHHIGKDGKLNMYDGIQGMKTARSFTASCAPSLQQATTYAYCLDDRQDEGWYTLTPEGGPAFGHDPVILPTLPSERWYKDAERTNEDKNVFVYARRPDPDESKVFKKLITDRPHGWEVFVRKNDVVVNIRPHVLAQLSAHAILADRGLKKRENIKMQYRLSNIRTQADPEVTEFKIRNTKGENATKEKGFKKGMALYARQRQGLTKLLAIESGKREFEETEMSELALPGTGFTIATKASRTVPLKGGVLCDAIGAGKTVITISIITNGLDKSRKYISSSTDPHDSGATLVVVPPGLIRQWKEEFDKFVDPKLKLKILTIYNLDTLKKTTANDITEADVVICPVDILEGEAKAVKDRAKYLKHLFSFTGTKVAKEFKGEVKNDQYVYDEAPKLPTTWGAKECIGVRGVWVAHTSADPYGQGASASQKKRDDCGFFTDRYSEIIDILRNKTKIEEKTKGVPLEYFKWERVVVDEIHESLCTTKQDIEDSAFQKGEMEFHERNRGAAREFLGIAQHDLQKRPLRARGCVFGLTGTPLLDSENRVIELANLMGGAYITSQRSHWRKCERESGRDSFIALWLEPQRSRMYRRERHFKAEDWLSKASQRDVAAALKVKRNECIYKISMSKESGDKYLDSTPSAIRNYNTMPPDFDSNAGQDPTAMLQCNATLDDRKLALRDIVANIQKDEEGTKILVFADTKYGAYQAACEALGNDGATFKQDDDDNETWNEKLCWYKTVDVTEEDKERPRVLVLTFEECAGLNLQTACNNVVLYAPMYSLDNDLVKDCSTEMQAIGRVYRTGQVKDVTVHRIVVYPPEGKSKEGEKTLDDWVLKRNMDPKIVAKATNAEE